MQRREFLNRSFLAGATCISLPLAELREAISSEILTKKTNAYRITRSAPTKFYDGKKCWCHPRAGIIPGVGNNGDPRVVLTMNSLTVSGSDVFEGLFGMITDDLGKTWSKPTEIKTLAPRIETIDGQKRPVAVSDFWPTWHQKTGRLLGTGHTVVYTPDWKVKNPRPRHTSYSVYDTKLNQWAAWKKLQMPDQKEFYNAGAGCVQRFDEPEGSILLPIYFEPAGKNSRVTVLRCQFDGKELTYQQQGNVIAVEDKTRGIGEPSLTKFQDDYFLTIRHDKRGYIATSKDGLHFTDPKPWTFDNGEPLGSYNTQQHWVTHSDALYLVYTRSGANNAHVFRHRAPLFMAQVDPKRLCVLRKTEQTLVPQRGARLGNFGTTYVNPEESWVTVSEWMQTWGPNYVMPVNNKYGSDGSLWIARIHWDKPNRV